MAAPATHFFPCRMCFGLRDVDTGLWLRSSAPPALSAQRSAFTAEFRPLRLGPETNRASFYYIYPAGGLYETEMPGDVQLEFYLMDASCPGMTSPTKPGLFCDGCLGHGGLGAGFGWTRCPREPGECQQAGGSTRCTRWRFGAVPLVDGTARSSGARIRVGSSACPAGTGALDASRSGTSAAVNSARASPGCRYVGVNASSELVSLVPFHSALKLEPQCIPCPTSEPTGRLYLILALLLAASLAPSIAMLAAPSARRFSRARPVGSQWPQRPQSPLIKLVFQLGWILSVAGFTPAILWYQGNWWPGHASYGACISMLGSALLMLTLRPDTQIWKLRAIAALFAFSQGGFALMERAHAVEVWERATQRPALDPIQLYAKYTIYFPMIFANVATLVVVPAAFPLLLSVILMRSPSAALRRLWGVLRSFGLVLATCYMVAMLVSLVATAVLGTRFTGFTRGAQSYAEIVRLDWTLFAATLFFCFAITHPSRRIGLHLTACFNRKAGRQATYFPPVESDDVTPPLPSTQDSVTGSEEDTPALTSCTRDQGSFVEGDGAEMGWLSSSSSSIFQTVDLRAWTGVDLKAWEDTKNRFSGLVPRKVIGHGGYSTVVLATLGQERVAVKLFRYSSYKDAGETRRLAMELAIAETLDHPCVVRALGTFVVDRPARVPALVLEFMGGGPLSNYIRESHTSKIRAVLPPETRVRIALEVAQALEYLHSRGVLHRDVKAANVLLTDSSHAKLADFGIATRFGAELDLASGVGTARYMAPESIFGPYEYRADVYSYSMLLWEVLHQELVFKHLSIQQVPIAVLAHNQTPSLRKLPGELAEFAFLVASCGSLEPRERPTMQEVAAAIGRSDLVSRVVRRGRS